MDPTIIDLVHSQIIGKSVNFVKELLILLSRCRSTVSEFGMTREGGGSSYSSHMRGVALSFLVMGLSLVAIIIAYESFGHVGPKFSVYLLVKQQTVLRKQYGLPPRPVITNDSLLLVPPSLRNITQNKQLS